MTWAPTSRLHVSGYRFLRRRMVCALLGRDIRTADEPLHAEGFALLTGSMLAAAAVAGCAIFGTLQPQPTLGDAPIVLAEDSGALYVRVGDVWHPVLNLASARLVAGSAVGPHLVRESAIGRAKRGPLLGIPGAPQHLGEPLPAAETTWTVCDSGGSGALTTTAIVGTAAAPPVDRLGAEQTVLATVAANSPVYLLYHGQRAVVDLADPVVTRALRLEDRRARRVSRTLLNAVPEAPPITVPRIAGDRRSSAVPEFPVGSVLRVVRADRDDYYAVLPDGVQRVGQVAADLIRLSDSRGARGITAVAPDVIGGSRTVNTLPVATFPDRPSAPLNDDDATLCATWSPGHSGADTSFWVGQGLPLPADDVPVALAQADNDGPALDAVYLPAGRNAYVRSAGLAGDDTPAAARYLVTDGGVRFGIHDDEAARALGLPAVAAVAPWPVLAALPQGPELSRQSASVPRDTVAAGFRTDPRPP
jgi:type VII secretion protein EccB